MRLVLCQGTHHVLYSELHPEQLHTYIHVPSTGWINHFSISIWVTETSTYSWLIRELAVVDYMYLVLSKWVIAQSVFESLNLTQQSWLICEWWLFCDCGLFFVSCCIFLVCFQCRWNEVMVKVIPVSLTTLCTTHCAWSLTLRSFPFSSDPPPPLFFFFYYCGSVWYLIIFFFLLIIHWQPVHLSHDCHINSFKFSLGLACGNSKTTKLHHEVESCCTGTVSGSSLLVCMLGSSHCSCTEVR